MIDANSDIGNAERKTTPTSSGNYSYDQKQWCNKKEKGFVTASILYA